MRKGSVWISEDEDHDETGFGRILTGRFSGFHETGGSRKAARFSNLDLDAALAWGRERADRVYLMLFDDRYEAGAERTGEYPPWPDGTPAPVRRRPPGEEWKDRTGADEPIPWIVQVWLDLAGGRMPDRGRDEEIAAIASRAGALSWDAAELDGALADAERAMRGRKSEEEGGWFSYHRGAYRLVFAERAPNAAVAVTQALERVGAPDGWRADGDAEPAVTREPSEGTAQGWHARGR